MREWLRTRLGLSLALNGCSSGCREKSVHLRPTYLSLLIEAFHWVKGHQQGHGMQQPHILARQIWGPSSSSSLGLRQWTDQPHRCSAAVAVRSVMATKAAALAAGANLVGVRAAAGGTPQRRRGCVLRAASSDEDMFDMSNVCLDDVFNLIQQVRLSCSDYVVRLCKVLRWILTRFAHSCPQSWHVWTWFCNHASSNCDSVWSLGYVNLAQNAGVMGTLLISVHEPENCRWADGRQILWFVYLRARKRFGSLWLWFCKMLRWIVMRFGHSCPYWTVWIWRRMQGE